MKLVIESDSRGIHFRSPLVKQARLLAWIVTLFVGTMGIGLFIDTNQHQFDDIRGEEMLPGPSVKTDEELLTHLREYAATVFYPVGTCKMGVDEMAVVGLDLKVRGVSNLRVADASIMPTLISGNTNAPSIMIGERAAAFIQAA